tara:strand:+ start:735 stop:1979 length:1245 start_codon:yes stop_codon:yes gene_type:complete
LFTIYNFIIQLVSVLIVPLAFISKKIKKGVIGREKTFKFLKSSIKPKDQIFWFHCASLGEYEQGLPIFEFFKKKYPKVKIVLSFFSPSGYEIKKDNYLTPLTVYLPLDTKKNAINFIKILNPKMAVFVKYELWPNYLKMLNNCNAKVFLISALFRPNHYFFKWYGRLLSKVLLTFDQIFTQDEDSKKLLKSIGINEVSVCGDTRYDRVLQQLEKKVNFESIEKFIDKKTCLIAGSTWQQDHELLIQYINKNPNKIKLIVVPHEINSKEIIKLKNKFKNTAELYSDFDNKSIHQKETLIVDCIGILKQLYKYANIAYVGGGMGNNGLHNSLEAAVYGIPIIIGKNYKKFPEAVGMINNGGMKSVRNYKEFQKCLNYFIDNKKVRQECGNKNKEFIVANKGATQIINKKIEEFLKN